MKNTHDEAEARIYNEIAQISVDTKCLRARVLNNAAKRPRRFYPAAAAFAVLVLAIISTTAYAVGDRLDLFVARFDPVFGSIAMPPTMPTYAVDHGIKLEVIGIARFDTVVLLHLTMEDVSSYGRLTRYMRPDLELLADGQLIPTPSRTHRLHFDNAANRLYLEIILAGDGSPPIAQLEIVATSITYARQPGQMQAPMRGSWRLPIHAHENAAPVHTWSDVTIGQAQLASIHLSPLGLHISGTHPDALMWNPQIEVEHTGRRNIRFSSQAGGLGDQSFSIFCFADSPINTNAVSAVVVDGERVGAGD